MRAVFVYIIFFLFFLEDIQAQKVINPNWKSHIKINPVRIGFDQLQIFYEVELAENKSIEAKIGYVYPSQFLNTIGYYGGFILDADDDGSEEVLIGNYYGASLSLGIRNYYKKGKRNNRRYYQLNGEVKFSLDNDLDLAYKIDFGYQSYPVNIDRVTVKPNILIGTQHNERISFDTYMGCGLALRFTGIKCNTDCNLEEIKKNFNSTNFLTIWPTIHIGTKLGIGVKRR